MDIIREHKNTFRGISLLTVSCIRIGIMTFALLIVYFAIMNMLGLHRILALRAFNILILGYGIIRGMRRYARHTGPKFAYFTGIRIGALISLVAVVPFAILTGIYLSYDTAFMNYLVDSLSMGSYLTPISVATGVAIEGLASGLIITFVVMPYFKEQ